ncbi:MAG: SusC/RagA family TonB-linked outer membrane protein [Segetibacter sp.]
MRKIVSFFTLLMLISMLAMAQTRSITGRVLDEAGAPVPSATVTETNTKNATTADENGNFSLRIQGTGRLTISSTGFQSQSATVQGNSVNVRLTRTSGQLSEVVVTALGQTRSKAKVGYATSTFNSAQVSRAGATNALDALSGKVPGANISKTGGPGSSTKVVLRGYGVIGENNQPLYVIDGIPLNDSRFGTSNTAGGTANDNVDFGNGLNDINPNDIESISILKGTSASSLYGSQARNGAIMITTKRGRSGKLKVDYAGSVNFSRVGKLPEMQNQFGQGWGGIFVLPENGSWGPRMDGKTRAWGSIVDNSQLIKPFSFIENNMRDFYNTGIEYNNTIGLSGGNETSQFYFSYGNVNSDGVIPSKTDYYQRNTFALRTNSKFNNFSLNSSFNYTNKKQNVPFTGQPSSDGGSTFEAILQVPVDIPITDFKDYHNRFFNVDNYFTPYDENPYYPLYENKNQQNSDRFFGNLDLQYKINNSLSAQLRVGGDISNARTFGYKAVNDPSIGSWNKGGNTEGASRNADVGSVSEIAEYIGSINSDFILKYNKSLSSDFNLEALAGVNYYQEDLKSSAAQITNLFIPGFYNLSNSLAPPTASDYARHRRRIGAYGQAIVGYRDQLFLTVNARNDWSSTLPINNNSFFYPGANLAWIASQTFNLTNTAISLLKFRASYGKTGSDASPYQVNPTLQLGSIGLGFGNLSFPFNGTTGFGISNTIGNSTLQPIIASEAEVGAELRMFKNRVGIDVALYDKKTKGQILVVPIAPSSGYTGLVNNLGVVDNKGIEIAFDAKPVYGKDFSWSITYTFSKNKNKVESLTAGLDKIILNDLYDAELDAYPGRSITGIYAPVPRYSPDGKIIVSSTTGMPVEAETKGFYGNAEYDYMMGMLNTFNYKGLQLSFSLDYRKGGVMYSGTADLLNFTGNAYNTTYNDRRPFIVPNSVIEIVSADGKSTYAENTNVIDDENYYDYYYHTQNKAGAYSARIIEKTFFKLRDITLSYNLPLSWASKIRSSNLSVGIYGRNFLLWTPKSNFYIDPEATNQGNDLNSELGEFRTAPVSQQYGVSLKANF